MRDFTAAHPSLPLGTFVKVTNLRNGKAVVVRINDRGPVVDGRIIDVSYNAAQRTGFQGARSADRPLGRLSVLEASARH
jgi:rare lipoprotein A